MQSYFKINLQSIKHNFLIFQKEFPEAFMAPVLKANAYGHGDIQVAAALRSVGASTIALGRLDEVQKLRSAGDQGHLLYLGTFESSDIPKIVEISQDRKLILTLSSYEQLKLLPREHFFRVHLKFDTGMTRLGFPVYANALGFESQEEKRVLLKVYLNPLIEELKKSPHIHVEGWMTHLHTAETPWNSEEVARMDRALDLKDDSSFLKALFDQIQNPTMHQLGIFYLIDQILRPIWPQGAAHSHNTAGALALNQAQGSARLMGVFKKMGLRPGLGIFGIDPTENSHFNANLKPSLSLWARIVMVKKVFKGHGVSYNQTWRAQKSTWVGVIPVGYGDGFPRLLSNQGFVFIRGLKCSIIGNVCMDYFMVDLTPLGASASEVIGEEALILGSSEKSNLELISVWSVAKKAQTIPWEILTRLTGRIQRVYYE